VTGRVPFDGPSPAAVMHKHLTGNLTPADHVNTRLTTGLGEVIERMMAKDPKQRYSSWADLIHDLEAVERGEAPPQARRQYDDKLLEGLSEGAPATVSAPVAPVPEEPAGPVVSLIWVIVLGTLLGISVILNLVLVLTR